MVKVLPAIFSYEDMKRRFAQDNPDDPYTRRKDLETGIYALDNWLIRVNDEDKAISTVGFKEHPSHTVVGGMYASAEGRQIGGNNRALQDAREPQLNQSKPLVAAFGHRDGDNARWIATAKKNGWSFPDSENWEQMKQLLPESVVNEWNSAYPNGNWAIRNIRGKGEFAKCVYLDDPTPSWFNLFKLRNKKKKKKEEFPTFEKSWKDILKILPDNTFNTMLDDTDNETEILSTARKDNENPHKYSKEHNIAFRPHYLVRARSKRIADHPDAKRTDLLPELADKIRELNLKTAGWAYLTDNPEDFAYITFAPFPPNYNEGTDMLSDSSPIVGKDKNKFDRKSIWRNPLKKVLIFLDSVRPTTQSYPLSSFNTFYDIWGTGIKKGHEGGDYAGHSEHIKDDKARQKRIEEAEARFSEASAKRTDYQEAQVKYQNWINQIRLADIKTERGDREAFRLTRKEHLKNLEQMQTLGIDKFAKNMINARTANKGFKEKKKAKMAARIEAVVYEYKKFLMNLKEADDRERARLRDLKEMEENKKEEE
tara:strand:- start:234 stop:1850 length:1617 start_codon:yes stop_codon:yes gene_type:complete